MARTVAANNADSIRAVLGLRQNLAAGRVVTVTSFKDGLLSAARQAGPVNNLNDGLACGLFPVLYVGSGQA